MIDLYTWGTPNGRKVSIMLEEVGLEYTVHEINIGKSEQHQPFFKEISPNANIPAIVDSDGPGGEPITMFESGAILVYLAEKTGSDLWPSETRERLLTLQWLMFQMGAVGPMFGQAHHFFRNKEHDVPYGKERYHNIAHRLYGVLNGRLGETEYLAGDDYTVADIATYPWVARFEWHQVDLGEYPDVKRWFDAVSARPAVDKGMKVPFLN